MIGKNRLAIYAIIGSGFVGGLLGVVPPMIVPARPVSEVKADTSIWKSVKLAYHCTDSLTIEEKVQDIEKMMSVDMTLMTTKRQTSTSDHSFNL